MIPMSKVISWTKLMRLEFYSMPFVVYSLGALISYKSNDLFFIKNFFVGYIIIFLIELATVLTNEYYDLEGDRLNKNPGRFTGGSRMLVENRVSLKEVNLAFIFVILSFLLFSFYLLKLTYFSNNVLILLILGMIFGIYYTAPPLKLSYRGVGEIDVAFTHGFYIIICGYVFQKRIIDSPIIFILSLPIFFSSLAIVSLGGIPDLESDRLVSKKTLVSLIGPKNTLFFSIFCILITGLIGTYLYHLFFSWKLNSLYLLLPIYSIYLSYIFLSKLRLKNYEISISKMIFRGMVLIALSSFIPLIIYGSS